jgi:NAD(P)H-hydrate epimerase
MSIDHHLDLLTTNQVVALESNAVHSGTPIYDLMQNAGTAVADEVIQLFEKQPTLVLCGPGNNGGDGFVVAKKLFDKLWPVSIAVVDAEAKMSEAAHAHRQLWQGEVLAFDPEILGEFSLIIDGLFGTGLTRPLGSPYKEMINAVNQLKRTVVAIDIPSGINSDTGEVMGTALKANLTITFGYHKLGHVLYPGRMHASEIIVKDIGLGTYVHPTYFINNPKIWLSHFPVPTPSDHKYTRGHAVIFGGDEFTGATQLASQGARRVGAGLVTIACSEKSHAIYALSSPGTLTKIVQSTKDQQQLFTDTRKNAFLFGPGLEPNDTTKKLIQKALSLQRTYVLDAGGLRAFADKPQDLFDLCHGNVVLTPHEGEFSALFDVSGSKLERALAAAEQSRCVIVLKGPDTIIASPVGHALIQTNAPPWLATAGSGDVLSGIILGYLAQGVDPFYAAAMATWIHARCAEEVGFGLISEDILQQLPTVLKSVWRLATICNQ